MQDENASYVKPSMGAYLGDYGTLILMQSFSCSRNEYGNYLPVANLICQGQLHNDHQFHFSS